MVHKIPFMYLWWELSARSHF